MKENVDKLKNYFLVNKRLMKFLIILCIIGIVMGSFYTVILSSSDKVLVKEYIEEYLQNLNKINVRENFLQLSLSQSITLMAIWLLGISIIGLPIILFVYFCKTFILGFSLSSFFITKGVQGFFLSFFYFFPCQLLNIIIYLFLMNYALSLSLKLIESFFKKKEINFKPILKKYCSILITSIFFMLLSNLLEVFVMPSILNFFLSMIK